MIGWSKLWCSSSLKSMISWLRDIMPGKANYWGLPFQSFWALWLLLPAWTGPVGLFSQLRGCSHILTRPILSCSYCPALFVNHVRRIFPADMILLRCSCLACYGFVLFNFTSAVLILFLPVLLCSCSPVHFSGPAVLIVYKFWFYTCLILLKWSRCHFLVISLSCVLPDCD